MKLRTLAIAVAAASISVSAQAEIDISGDIQMGWESLRADGLGDFGSELTVKGSRTEGNLKYFGSFELDAAISDSLVDRASLDIEEVRFGVSGPFGTIEMGDTDNACDKMTTGGDFTEIGGAGDDGDCPSTDSGTIRYSHKLGKLKYAVSHNVDVSESSVGAQYTTGKTTVSLGHVQRSGALENVTAVGLKSTVGPVQIKGRANTDDDYSLHLGYTAGKNTFHIGTHEDDSDEKDGTSIGWNRKLSSGTTSYVTAYDYNASDDIEFGVGVLHKF